MARKPRNLSREERELWQRAIARAEPLSAPGWPGKTKTPKAKAEPRQPDRDFFESFRVGSKASVAPVLPGLSRAPLRMDAKAYRKMKGGRLRPEARLDLHGLTLSQAQPRLSAFIETSMARGLRLVLVITGKGRPGSETNPVPSRPGVLRRQVPHWLRAMPAVLEVSEANRKHGGAGALYVYLRRRRG